MKQTTFQMQPHLCWKLESAIVAARKGWSKQTGASHPRSQNSTKFQTGGDSITVVPQQYIQYSGGSGTKKGDRGYIRLIPRAATTPCVPLSPAIILRKSALYPWESLMLMILALSSTFYPLLPPKSPPNSRERFGFSQKSYMMRKKFNKRQHYYPIGIELILCGNLLDIELCLEVPWIFWRGHQIQTLVG